MLLKKEGFPEEDDLVMCTITKVHFHSVFVDLDEYGKQGMIHISEVSPGRIRNIRDFVIEGKKIVCKVLKVHLDRGHIDLSLRRVTEIQKRQKVDEMKMEQKAEKIIEYAAKDLKSETKKLFDIITKNILSKYSSVYDYFHAVASSTASIEESGLDAKSAKTLEEAIKSRIKETAVTIEGTLKLSSYDPNGIEIVKEALKKAEAVDKVAIKIKYLGSGSYHIIVEAKDYKQAEKLLKQSYEKAVDHMKKHEGMAEFIRAEA